MSIRPNAPPSQTVDAMLSEAVAQGAGLHDQLAEGNGFSTVDPDHPLHRDVVVSIRATLSDLCLQKNKAVWSPTPEALRSMFQQRKFTSLDGASESSGDLKSVVLHNLEVKHSKSTFPVALGARVTCVDDNTYSTTGEAYSTVVLPNSDNSNVRKLQADDVSLAYEFSRKFPGYTSENLATKGIHEVSARRFVLVAADHPIVQAISENQHSLQMGEISMMPEGLVKISQSLYDSILPPVQTQVASQIKVRDLSRATVAVQPSEYATWKDAREALIVEAKKPIKAQFTSAIQAAGGDAGLIERAETKFAKQQSDIEHEIDHKVMELHMQLGCDYNFLSK